MNRYIKETDVYKLVEPSGVARVYYTQIDDLPRADVVEVVRCKDCIHFDKSGACNHFGYYSYVPDVDEDDFCSYGERREEK